MYLFFSPPFLYVTPCSSSSWSTFSPSFPSSLDFSPQPFPSFSRNPLLSIVLDFSLQYHTNLTLPNPFCYLHFHELWSLLQSPLSPPRDTLYRFIQLTPEVLFLFQPVWHASNPWFCESASSLFDSHSPEIKCYSTLLPFVLSCYLLTDLLFFVYAILKLPSAARLFTRCSLWIYLSTSCSYACLIWQRFHTRCPSWCTPKGFVSTKGLYYITLTILYYTLIWCFYASHVHSSLSLAWALNYCIWLKDILTPTCYWY